MPVSDAGQVIDPSVSVPIAADTIPAATATALPDDDPHADRSSAYGLRVSPPAALHPLTERAAPDVGPLAEVGLAQDHRARRAQPRHQRRIAPRHVVRQRQRPGRGGHRVGRLDVVLHQHGHPVQRPARPPRRALRVQRARVLGRPRVQRQHRVQRRPGPVEGRHPVEGRRRGRLRRQAPVAQRVGQRGGAQVRRTRGRALRRRHEQAEQQEESGMGHQPRSVVPPQATTPVASAGQEGRPGALPLDPAKGRALGTHSLREAGSRGGSLLAGPGQSPGLPCFSPRA